MSASVPAECGSFSTVSGCSCVAPSTVSRTVYCPGGISTEICAPPGAGRPSSPTSMCSAYIGDVSIRIGSFGSSRRSQWIRFTPARFGASSVRTTVPPPSRISIIGASEASPASQ